MNSVAYAEQNFVTSYGKKIIQVKEWKEVYVYTCIHVHTNVYKDMCIYIHIFGETHIYPRNKIYLFY